MLTKAESNNSREDLSLVFHQWNLLEHTIMDFKVALMKAFSTNFSTNNNYKNNGLVVHLDNLKEKGYTYNKLEQIFDATYLCWLLESNFEMDEDIKKLLTKFYNLESFKFNFILEDWERVNFDFTENNNTLEDYTTGLLWFFDTGYVWDIDIEYID